MPLLRPRLRTLLVVVVFSAIGMALLVAIRTVDDREKPASYRWVAGWVACVLVLSLAIRRWGPNPFEDEPGDRPDLE